MGWVMWIVGWIVYEAHWGMGLNCGLLGGLNPKKLLSELQVVKGLGDGFSP